jgi:RNA polymerase sigma-70 factor (ECF subfamily)
MTQSESDRDFIKRAVAGEQDALVQLLERHGPTIRQGLAGAIPRRWQSQLSLDDVMQQTYTDAFLAIERFEDRGTGSFCAWMATLAERNLVDAMRMLKAEKRGGDRAQVGPVVGSDSFVGLYEFVTHTTTPSRHAARDEARLALEQAVEQLPATYHQVVRMYDLEEQPIEAVAAALGRTVGAVYMLRARAHDRLGEILGPASDYLSDTA